jgi:trigger factor
VLDAAVAEATIEVPDKLVHGRAHEMLEDAIHSLSHRGISKEAYLRITGKDEEELAHEAEPEAREALKREAVLAAIVEAEVIAPSDEELIEAMRPAAERENIKPEKAMERLRKNDRLERAREDLANRQALELIVREAKPIPVEQAKAREKLWTPGHEPESGGASGAGGSGQLWTPGS